MSKNKVKKIKGWAVRGKFNRLIVAYERKEYAENFSYGRIDAKDVFPCTISYSIPKTLKGKKRK